jgi:hypothetical protein
LDLPPLPPQGRNWKGSVVAPFAGNNMLVLYQCPSKISDGSTISGGRNNSYLVQVLHNEVPVSMPVSLIASFYLCFLHLLVLPCHQDITKFAKLSLTPLNIGTNRGPMKSNILIVST